MYEQNILSCITKRIPAEKDFDAIKDILAGVLKEIGPIFSCVIYAEYKRDKFIGYMINFNISQNDTFNVLTPLQVFKKVLKKISIHFNTNEKKYIIGYMQPPLELLMRLFDPLIQKLAYEQHQRWTFLEYDDLCQMCRLVMSDLYYKGYYIHKRLLYKAFNNYVLMHIRKDRCKPEVYSLEQEWSKRDDDDYVTLADMIPDTKLLEDLENKDNDEVENRILDEMRGIIVDFIGQRQYDQLLREYGNKSTTPWSRKLMVKIKAHLFEMGINGKSFKKYYE
jgi:hypothetical protein